MDTSDSKSAVKSADRVLDVFELLARWARPLSHSEIAEQLGIPKSSLTQLLHTLVQCSYLDFSTDDRGYTLGASVLALASQQSRMRDLVALARPVLENLTRETGESSALNMLRGDMSVVAATVVSPHRLISHMREGDEAPLYATSGGKVLLSFLPDGMRREYLERVQLRRLLPATIHNVATLKREIDKVRSQGHATVVEEFVAMPIQRWSDDKRTRVLLALQRDVSLLERQLQATVKSFGTEGLAQG
jgi:DNA-binding IclR family transcriptional regulator